MDYSVCWISKGCFCEHGNEFSGFIEGGIFSACLATVSFSSSIHVCPLMIQEINKHLVGCGSWRSPLEACGVHHKCGGWGCYCLWVGIKERNSPSRSKGAVESGCVMRPSESVISWTLRPSTRSHMWTASVCTRQTYGCCDSPDVTGVALQASHRPPRIYIPHVRLPASKVRLMELAVFLSLRSCKIKVSLHQKLSLRSLLTQCCLVKSLQTCRGSCALSTCLAGSLFHLEDESNMFLRNVTELLLDYTASRSTR
jgi:hypothetical protein